MKKIKTYSPPEQKADRSECPGMDLVAHSLHLEYSTELMRKNLEKLNLKNVADDFMFSLRGMTNREWIILVTTFGVWLQKEQ